MTRLAVLLLLAMLTISGCQTKGARAALDGRKVDEGPKAIPVLHRETLVYECPKCGMDYEAAGQCTMCKIDLVKTAVAYKCPTDGQAVEHSGKCPRCAASAVVEKTTIADAGGATPRGN